MTGILEHAAKAANAQRRVESFGDRRPDRIRLARPQVGVGRAAL
jgi:hypothetical protein